MELQAPKKGIIIGISSDIGMALCNNWLLKEWKIAGTYRTPSNAIHQLKSKINYLIHCDLSSPSNVDHACACLKEQMSEWDVLIMGPGLLDPIGCFSKCNFDEWAESITVNFTNQLRCVHRLLTKRNLKKTPTILFFAGGGTNSAPTGYSAYIASKIALIKMTEILAIEIPDVNFVIVGPGWVNTKIHEATLNARDKHDSSYQQTIKMLNSNACTPMTRVVECCNWLINNPKKLITGRNFSVVFDKWGDPELDRALEKDADMYKLRRFGNDF